MKKVVRLMIKDFGLRKLGYDFMGYTFRNVNDLSFHHLIIAMKDSNDIPSKGYVRWNGAILNQETSHDYLHLIETIDRDVFLYITHQMIVQNQNGRLDIEQLKLIRSALLSFEKEHMDDVGSKGKRLIKQQFIYPRINL